MARELPSNSAKGFTNKRLFPTSASGCRMLFRTLPVHSRSQGGQMAISKGPLASIRRSTAELLLCGSPGAPRRPRVETGQVGLAPPECPRPARAQRSPRRSKRARFSCTGLGWQSMEKGENARRVPPETVSTLHVMLQMVASRTRRRGGAGPPDQSLEHPLSTCQQGLRFPTLSAKTSEPPLGNFRGGIEEFPGLRILAETEFTHRTKLY